MADAVANPADQQAGGLLGGMGGTVLQSMALWFLLKNFIAKPAPPGPPGTPPPGVVPADITGVPSDIVGAAGRPQVLTNAWPKASYVDLRVYITDEPTFSAFGLKPEYEATGLVYGGSPAERWRWGPRWGRAGAPTSTGPQSAHRVRLL